MRLSIANKLSIVVATLILLSIAVSSWLFYNRTIELLVEEAIDDTSKQMRVTGDTWKDIIATQKTDVLYLATSIPVQEMARQDSRTREGATPDDKQWKEKIRSLFVTVLETKPSYQDIALINKNGQTLVDVRKGQNSVVGRQQGERKRKKSARLLDNALALSAGDVYLSDISLKREDGIVVEPHLEVLRAATPVYDEQTNTLQGLVVITVDIGDAFHSIQRMITHTDKEIFITNDSGGYLLHRDPFRAYGFDLGKRFRVQEDIPEVAALYLPDNRQSQTVLKSGYERDQKIINFTKIFFDDSQPERFIAVGIMEPYSRILAEEQDLLKGVVAGSIVLMVIAVLIAIFVSYKITRPINRITSVLDGYINNRDIQTNIPVTGKDEIGVLARSFETLMAQVNDAQHGLMVMNKNLELRVIERTKKLEYSERRQRSIVDNIADGLITMDGQGVIESFNKAATIIFAYDHHEVIGKNIKMLMPEPHRSQHDNYLKHYHQSGIRKVIGSTKEVEAVAKDGSVIPIELSVSEIVIDNKKMFTGVLRDVSERKQIEKLKSQFVSTVSHELRTPLTSIRGVLGLIVGGAIGKIPDEMKDMLVVAENNAKRLLLLINDILDIQKIENNDIRFQFEEIEIPTLIEDAIKENQNVADEYNVKFIQDKTIATSYVEGDRTRLMQVINNLFSNAAKFSPQNSVVKISTYKRDKFVCIDVVDSGTGIPDEFKERVFDTFTQSDSSDTRTQGGTGLGLSISRSIIDRHNGSLSFTSPPGGGTVFTIELLEVVPRENRVVDISGR